MATNAKGWVLTSRPTEGPLTADYFDFTEYELPPLQDGEFLIKTQMVSLDPTHRIWASDAPQYMEPQPLGRPMRAGAIGVIEESRNNAFKVGSTVKCFGAWASHHVVSKEMASQAMVLPADNSVGDNTIYMALLGAMGLTAHYGYTILNPDGGGKTFVVDGAAGGVGSLILQIMKHQAKCRCIAICGSDEKAAWTREIGADHAINYKTENVTEKLKEYAADGIDYAFENVGGVLLSSILSQMNNFGRIAVCGLISQYNNGNELNMAQENFQMILMRRLTVRGFICSDYFEEHPVKAANYANDLISWHKAGQLTFRVDKQKGLENILTHYNRLYTGQNTGKLVVEIA